MAAWKVKFHLPRQPLGRHQRRSGACAAQVPSGILQRQDHHRESTNIPAEVRYERFGYKGMDKEFNVELVDLNLDNGDRSTCMTRNSAT